MIRGTLARGVPRYITGARSTTGNFYFDVTEIAKDATFRQPYLYAYSMETFYIPPNVSECARQLLFEGCICFSKIGRDECLVHVLFGV